MYNSNSILLAPAESVLFDLLRAFYSDERNGMVRLTVTTRSVSKCTIRGT
jgi:hypothetical protein